MNKCPHCETEFEGNFCPECGKRYEAEKTCPSCGAISDGAVKFCAQCGYAFVGGKRSARRSANSVRELNDKIIKIFYIGFKYVPCALFALFSVLLFAFYAGAVAVMPGGNLLGVQVESVSYGNVYSLYDGILGQVPELEATMLTLIIAACLFVVISVVSVLLFVLPQTRIKTVGLFKKNLCIAEAVAIFLPVGYIIFIIIGAVIMGYIAHVDDGVGLIAAGACPKLIIAFGAVFFVLSCVTVVVRFYIAKRKPELEAEEQQWRADVIQAEQDRREEFYKTHPIPTMPDPLPADALPSQEREYERACVRYGHDSRRYLKAKEGKTPAIVIWLDMHTVFIIVVSLLVAAAIVGAIILSNILNNIFDIDKVREIELGSSPSSVKSILGDPYAPASDDNCWRYFTSDYTDVADKIKRNAEQQEQALKTGNMSNLNKLTAEAQSLKKQLEKVKYEYIEIKFEQNSGEKTYRVVSVLYDADKKGTAISNKQQLRVENSQIKSLKQVYYVDYTSGELVDVPINVVGTNVSDAFIMYKYSADFTDGSYVCASLRRSQVSFSRTGVTWYVNWSDSLSKYSSVCQSLQIGTVAEDGSWKTSDSGKKEINTLECPRSVTSIADDGFRDCSRLTQLVIPNTVKTIGDEAFRNSGLTSITLPSSIESLGARLFYDCRSLKYIYYDGTKEQFEQISKAKYWATGSGVYSVICSDGSIKI